MAEKLPPRFARKKIIDGQEYFFQENGGAYLCEVYYFRSPTLRPGFQPAHGGAIVNAAEFCPEAWDFLKTPEGQLLCKTEADWKTLSNAAPWNGIGGVPWFVQDLAAGTLRLPDLRGMYPEAANFDGLGVGDTHPDAIVNISGGASLNNSLAANAVGSWQTYGAFLKDGSNNPSMVGTSGSLSGARAAFYFSAAQQVRTANKVAPRAWGALACVYLGQPQGA